MKAAVLRVAVVLLVVAVLYPGLRDGPISRDEVVYDTAARYTEDWLRTFATAPLAAASENEITQGWGYNHEHPAFAKLLAATSDLLAHRWIDPVVALRLGNALLAALLVLEVFQFLLAYEGLAAAAFGAAAILLIPCLYGNACIVSMDFPMAALTLMATTAFLRGTERPMWAVVFGVWMGLALNTKINAAFIPLPLLLWALAYRRRESADNLFALLLVAPAVWVLTWPWLWHDSGHRLLEYLEFHQRHPSFNTIYFGHLYIDHLPPWHYSLVYLILTVPVPILAAALAGIAAALAAAFRRDVASEVRMLLLVSLAAPVVLASLPGVPKYDPPRLFLNAFPFVACLAGIGFGRVFAPAATAFARRLMPRAERLAIPGLALLLLGGAAGSLARVHPFEAYSYYNVLVGGPAGAMDLGLSPVLWAMSDRTTVDYLNRHAAPHDVVYDGTGASQPLRGYQLAGELGDSLRWGSKPQWVVLEYNLAYSNWMDWWMFHDDQHPWYEKVYEVVVDGAPVLGVFHAREAPLRDRFGAIPPTLVRPPDPVG